MVSITKNGQNLEQVHYFLYLRVAFTEDISSCSQNIRKRLTMINLGDAVIIQDIEKENVTRPTRIRLLKALVTCYIWKGVEIIHKAEEK